MINAGLTLKIDDGGVKGAQRWNIWIKNNRATWFIDGQMYGRDKPKESVVHHFDALLPSMLDSEQRAHLVGFVAKA